MRNQSHIKNSGNANVTVNVQVDTSSLAYSMACYWHASGIIKDEQFVQMITNLNSLLGKGDVPLPPLLSNFSSQEPEAPNNTYIKNDLNTLRKFI